MADVDTIAQWMVERIEGADGLVRQSDLAAEIGSEFGADWTSVNPNGHPTIDNRVLVRFRKLHGGRIRWDREEFGWHANPESPAEV
jgi:hypothetical protein